MANRERLFAEFEVPTREQWLEKIGADLKGADFEKRLVWRTGEGFSVQPFYRRDDLEGLPSVASLPGEFPFVRGNRTDNNLWRVRQDIDVADAGEANAKALDILNRGVDSLGFNLPSDMVDAATVASLLDGVYCDIVEVNFSTCKRRSPELARLLAAYFDGRGCDRSRVSGSIDWDPVEKILLNGADVSPVLSLAGEMVAAVAPFPEFRCVAVNSRTLCNSGAYIYQELGYALAWGCEYMQLLTDAGVPAGEAARRIKFNMGVSENYFMEIAKFRAARLLWAQIVRQFAPEREADCKMHVCAVTSEYNQTLFDSYVNLLRSQTEAMSAALSNVESIVVTPFDSAYESPNDFSERLARNQQLLLKEEAHFDKLVDVSGGSYYVERLTDAIAREAWKLFLSVEEDGGFLAQALAGKVQEAVNASNAKRHGDAAKRREFLLGTNQFPNFTEKSDGKRAAARGCGCGHDAGDAPIARLDRRRLASEFEELRLRTEAAAHRPVAFMLTVGNLAMRQARAQFSCNFLACAGYRVVDNLGFNSVEEGVDAALAAGADIVVLCSSDDEYAEYAVPAFRYLGGRAMFVVAGAPACMDELKAAGIENYIHVRANQLETLRAYNEKLLK